MIKKILNILLIVGVMYVVVSACVHHDRYHSLVFHFHKAATVEAPAPSRVVEKPAAVELRDSSAVATEGASDSLSRQNALRGTVAPASAADTVRTPRTAADTVR